MREGLPPVQWGVPGILPEGLSLLTGKPKLRKSCWSLVGDADEHRISEERRDVLETIRAAGAEMPRKEIAEALGKSVGSEKVLLGEMVKAGQVSNLSYGKYDLPRNTPYSGDEEEGKSKRSKDGTRDGRVTCIHGFAAGLGCYLCDPEHPYRKAEGGTRCESLEVPVRRAGGG
jgi:hypothetical protein